MSDRGYLDAQPIRSSLGWSGVVQAGFRAGQVGQELTNGWPGSGQVSMEQSRLLLEVDFYITAQAGNEPTRLVRS